MVISKRLIAGFSLIICLAVIVGVIGINGMQRLREASHSVYESHVLGLEYTGKAAAAFKQVRLHSRQVVIDSFYDNLWGAYETEQKFAASADEFRYWINSGMSATTSEELLRFYTRILDIFENEFVPKAKLLIETSIRDVPDHADSLYVNVLLVSLIENGEQLENVLIGSMDLITALVWQANQENNSVTSLNITIQWTLLTVAVVAAAIIALFITKSITVPINEAARVLSKVAKGDFSARVKGEYKGELQLIQNSVNEMAAQLSVYLREKMREEKSRSFATILSIADAGILIKDRDGLITDWNVGAEKILGYKQEETIGRTTAFLNPDGIPRNLNISQGRQLSAEHEASTEDIRIHKDGRLITCSASQTPLFDEEGVYNGSVVVFHDITERMRAEQKVKRFASIIESADACIITTDKDFVIQGWNNGAEHILGYSAEEIIGKTARFYIPPSEQYKIDAVYERLRKGASVERTDDLRIHKNGSMVDCSIYYTPYFDDQGRFDGAVAVIHDISARKRMEQELKVALDIAEEASMVKSTFLANMSHEIRTPMNAVISMTELMLEERLTPKQHSYLMDIKTSGANLLGIINDILDFSKIESGRFEIVPVHYDLLQMLRNLQSTFEFIARGKQLEFIAQIEEPLPRCLYGDDIRVLQILTNLLSNAVKFTSQGHVMLKTHADERAVYFDVSDTGMGIKPESIDMLFDSFQQLDTSANRRKTGTGLGLSITKSLVELMGGTISVTSEYGVGTVFSVALPRVDGDPERIKADAEGGALSIDAPDARVLVVDDYEANLRVASGLLELSGIRCDTAGDGESAIGMVTEKPYDLIFMDHMMPGMDGVETMLRIRGLGFSKEEMPIVALTANAISGVREMLIGQGMNDFLSKPIDRALLTEILIKWLPKHKVRVIDPEDAARDGAHEKREASALIRGLREMPDVHVNEALAMMGGAEALYESTFKITHRMIPENIAKLDAFIVREGLRDFAVEVHGLKGALNYIGVSALGDYAARLEKAAKDNDGEYCAIHYGEFKRRLLVFHEQSAHMIGGTVIKEREAGDIALLGERLAGVRAACEDYDAFGAYEILAELVRFDYSDEINALIERAHDTAERCDYDGALELVGCLEGMVGRS